MTFQEYPFINAPWMDTQRRFLRYTGSTIQTPDLQVPSIIRSHDQSIMDIALRLNFNIAQLKLINNSRLYLQIITVAEIVTNDGQRIRTEYLKPNKSTKSRHHPCGWSKSTYRWPTQTIPNNKAW